MTKVLMIAAGGAVGSSLRYLVADWGQKLTGGTFPLGTITVNVVGCLLIGVLGARFVGPVLPGEEYKLAIIVGVLGGFTTFSTFGWETLSMLNEAQYGRAMTYVLGTNVLALAAVWVGYRLSQHFWGV